MNTFVTIFANKIETRYLMEDRLFDNSLFALEVYDKMMQPNQILFNHGNFWIHLRDQPMACMNQHIGE